MSSINEIIEHACTIFPKEYVKAFKVCIQCGVCVGSCPSGRKTPWNVRKTLYEARLGHIMEVLSNDNLWNCTTCYTCQERCPLKVPITDLVRILRNQAIRYGYIKEAHRKVCENLFKYGHAVPINDEIKKIRAKLGLPEIPLTVHSYPESLKEIQKLIEKTGFITFMEENK